MEAREYNAAQLASGRLNTRHITQLIRFWQRHHKLPTDGMAGQHTVDSLDRAWDDMETPAVVTVTAEPPDQSVVDFHPSGRTVWPSFDGPLKSIPRNRQEILEVFGDPGTVATPSKAWRKQSIVSQRGLPGVPSKLWTECHRLAEPYLREGLARAQRASSHRIDRLGCFMLRHVREDPARPLSLHSWGIAVDVNPDLNRGIAFDRGRAPAPWGEEWKHHWPKGIDQAFVEAMESVGFTWGGAWGRRGDGFADRVKRVAFCDPMHFELRDNLG